MFCKFSLLHLISDDDVLLKLIYQFSIGCNVSDYRVFVFYAHVRNECLHWSIGKYKVFKYSLSDSFSRFIRYWYCYQIFNKLYTNVIAYSFPFIDLGNGPIVSAYSASNGIMGVSVRVIRLLMCLVVFAKWQFWDNFTYLAMSFVIFFVVVSFYFFCGSKYSSMTSFNRVIVVL